MFAKTVIIIAQIIMFANRKSVKLVGAIRMLIGLTDIFAKHTRQKVRIRNDRNSILGNMDATSCV